MLRVFILLFTFPLLTSCTFLEVNQGERNLEFFQSPKLNQITTKRMGDRMVTDGYGYWVDCFTTLFSKSHTNVNTIYVKEGKDFCSLIGVGGDSFTPNYLNYSTAPFLGAKAPFESASMKTPVRLKKIKSNEVELCIDLIDKNSCIVKSENEFKFFTKFISDDLSFQQTIEYMGRDGNTLKFVYAEFKDDIARQAFTREFTVDIGNSSILNFKGLKVKILEASNEEITYEVLKFFNS